MFAMVYTNHLTAAVHHAYVTETHHCAHLSIAAGAAAADDTAITVPADVGVLFETTKAAIAAGVG